MDNLEYLFAAYTAVWLVLAGYLWRLSRRAKMLEDEITRLKEVLPGSDEHGAHSSTLSRSEGSSGSMGEQR